MLLSINDVLGLLEGFSENLCNYRPELCVVVLVFPAPPCKYFCPQGATLVCKNPGHRQTLRETISCFDYLDYYFSERVRCDHAHGWLHYGVQ